MVVTMWSCKTLVSVVTLQKQAVLVPNQITRFYRKPRWLPIAKTKLFRIPVRPVIPVEETEELKRLFNNYRTQIKAVRRHLHYEFVNEMDSLANIKSEKSMLEEKIDLDRCFALNDEWNKKIAEERDTYSVKAKERLERRVNRVVDLKDKIKEHIIAVADQSIKEEIEKSKTFITFDNLDEAIDACLNSEIDHNYAIDLEGNYYHGRKTNSKNVTLNALNLD